MTPARLRRSINGIRKVVAGLTPFGESVWPGVRNDLFVAHESIYTFFARFSKGRAVLDGGCGTGYGTHLLASMAKSVVGLDVDRRSIRYARRHYRRANLSFAVADLDAGIPDTPARFDVVVSSNCLEHLEEPRTFLSEALRRVEPDGLIVVAVPPITSESSREVHRGIHYHRSNFSVDQWYALFDELGAGVEAYRHVCEGAAPDFHSPFESALVPEQFDFPPATRNELYAHPTITALFVLAPRA